MQIFGRKRVDYVPHPLNIYQIDQLATMLQLSENTILIYIHEYEWKDTKYAGCQN